MSWNEFENDPALGQILITGPDVYKYIVLKYADKEFTLNLLHSQLNGRDHSLFSGNITCHAWNKNNCEILLCTDNGEMIICENSGEFKATVIDSQKGRSIECVQALESGDFLIALENALVCYRPTSADRRAPIK